MTYYQACCTLVAVILAIAIHIDPTVNYIFTQPVTFLKRLLFALFYYAVTVPSLVIWVTQNFPMTSIQFYSWLMLKYVEVYPEGADADDDDELE